MYNVLQYTMNTLFDLLFSKRRAYTLFLDNTIYLMQKLNICTARISRLLKLMSYRHF